MADPVRVFISYSSKDADLVDRLKAALAQAGVYVWLDHEQLTPGTPNWQVKVREGLGQATTVVYVASETAAASAYVHDEINIASDKGKTVIPFWVRGNYWHDCIPLGFGATQRIDGRDAAYTAGLAKLLTTLGVANTTPAVPSLAVAQPMPPLWSGESLLRQFAEAKAQPNIIPIGARFGAMEEDKRLMPATTHTITVQNTGESAASHIFAVLFPSVAYFNNQGISQGDPPLGGTYWQGRFGAGVVPSARCEIPLEEMRWPLMGNFQVTPQYDLYAPVQPPPEERRVRNAHFYSARLTITCRNSLGIRFATIFDLDADRLAQNRDDIWDQILLPTEVEPDLRELTAKWEKKRQPPLFGG